jgi:hypothetical protein
MIRFYFHPTPNPAKIALFLEEAGLPYEAIPVATRRLWVRITPECMLQRRGSVHVGVAARVDQPTNGAG